MGVTDTVRERILARLQETRADGRAKLPSERALAEEFGVSRGTVREALKSIESHGGVAAQHGSAWSVHGGLGQLVEAFRLQMRLGELEDVALLESRVLIEPAIAYLAATRGEPDAVADLSRAYLHTERANDDDLFLEHDIAFHEQLARAAGNGYLVLATTPLLTTLQRLGHGELTPTRKKGIVTDHKRILDAVLAGDGGAAQEAMLEHLDNFARSAGLSIAAHTHAAGGRA